MKEKSSGRFIQVSVGILIMVISVLYLWRDTLVPILKAKQSRDSKAEVVYSEARLGDRYLSWKERADEARARALEAELERQRAAASGK